MKKNQSPCINICQFSGPHGWCLGCGRTKIECQNWKTMKPYHRTQLIKELKKRMLEISFNSKQK